MIPLPARAGGDMYYMEIFSLWARRRRRAPEPHAPRPGGRRGGRREALGERYALDQAPSNHRAPARKLRPRATRAGHPQPPRRRRQVHAPRRRDHGEDRPRKRPRVPRDLRHRHRREKGGDPTDLRPFLQDGRGEIRARHGPWPLHSTPDSRSPRRNPHRTKRARKRPTFVLQL
jgi:hypothetical protein